MKKRLGKTNGIDAEDRFIASLYRSGLSIPPEGFRAWALGQIKTLIPYDGALWGSGSLNDWRFHTVTLIGMPPEYPSVLEETRLINPIWARMLTDFDTPVDMEQVLPGAKFYKSEIYRRCFKRFGINRLLATAHADSRSGLASILSLYRFSRRTHFTSTERALLRRCTFHLFQAASHAYFLQLMRTVTEQRASPESAAVVDGNGAFYEAQPRFLDLLEKNFPNRVPGNLPFAPPPAGITEMHNNVCVKSQPLGDLSCVLMWPAGPLDRLTVRERDIVDAITKGMSFKQAARKIGVAPSTVSNHLYRIYRKIGVNSRSELAGMVHP